jgi:hypothetical protein
MSQIAPIVLADGKSTPVNHTFSPVHVRDGVAMYADRSTGIQVGFATIQTQMRDPVGKSRLNKVMMKIDVPVLEQTSPSTTTGIQPAPTKAYSLAVDLVAMLPERSTLAERKDLLAFLRNFVAGSVFGNYITDYDRTYG